MLDVNRAIEAFKMWMRDSFKIGELEYILSTFITQNIVPKHY